MDPLSVIASITGILAAAAKVSSLVVDVTKKSKHAPQSIKNIKVEVDSFRVSLEQLQVFVLRKQAANRSRSAWILVNQVVVVLSGSVITFSELEVFVDSLKSDDSIGILDRLRWAAKASTAEELLGKVQSHKISMITMLTILESQSTLEAEEAVYTLTSMVEQVLKSNQMIEERLKAVDLGAMVSNSAPKQVDIEVPVHVPDPEPPLAGPPQRNLQGFAFEEELNKSWVYKRSNNGDEGFSVISAAGRSATWSMLSGLSMSDVSNISILALPLYETDVANKEHYQFGDPGTMVETSSSEDARALTPGSSPAKSRRQLRDWWRSFNRSIPQQSTTIQALGIFGVALRSSIPYANVAISLLDEDGKTYIYGYVPIVVAKCGVRLKETGTEVQDIFHQDGFAPRIQELKIGFDSPERYGKGLDWTGYTIHDTASILLRYLKLLPEPVIPVEHYRNFVSAFTEPDLPTTAIEGAALDESSQIELKAILNLQERVTELPPLHRQLLLYILDLTSVFARKSDHNKMTSDRLAACFQPAILSLPPEQMTEEKHELAHKVVVFLIDKQENFLVDMWKTIEQFRTERGLSPTKHQTPKEDDIREEGKDIEATRTISHSRSV